MKDIIFYAINAIAEIYILFRYFHVYLGEMRVSFRIATLLSLVLLVAYIRVNLFGIPIANLTGYFILMTAVSIIYPGSLRKKVVYNIAMAVANLAVDLFLLQLFVFLGHNMVANYYLHGFTSTLVRMVLIQIVVLRGQPEDWEYDPKILYIVSGIWGLIILYALLFMPNLTSADPSSLRWFFFDAMLMLMSLLIFLLFEISTKKRNAEKRADEIALQMKSQEKYYRQFERYEYEIRSLKHDMKHFMLGLLNYDDAEKEEQILKRLGLIESTNSTFYTENELIQLLLQNLVGKLDIFEEGIVIQCDVPKQLDIENTDLSILLGNLFDNMAEALATLPVGQRNIKIQMNYTPLRLQILLANTFLSDEPKILKKNRAFGTKSIRRIVEKYDGVYIVNTTSEEYITEIILTF